MNPLPCKPCKRIKIAKPAKKVQPLHVSVDTLAKRLDPKELNPGTGHTSQYNPNKKVTVTKLVGTKIVRVDYDQTKVTVTGSMAEPPILEWNGKDKLPSKSDYVRSLAMCGTTLIKK